VTRNCEVWPELSSLQHAVGYCGLSYIWNNQIFQGSKDLLLNKISESLEDQFKQDWHYTVFSSSKCTNYRMYKLDHKFKFHLIVLDPVHYRQIVNYRLCNNYLPLETLRWYNVDRNDRTCPLCNSLDVGDELLVYLLTF